MLVVFVAPPWGDALSESSGLDLARTSPPVSEIVALLAARFLRRRLIVAVQVYEAVEPASLAALETRLAWSAIRTYDVDVPGRNHGLLTGTLGWEPESLPEPKGMPATGVEGRASRA